MVRVLEFPHPRVRSGAVLQPCCSLPRSGSWEFYACRTHWNLVEGLLGCTETALEGSWELSVRQPCA